MNSLLRAILILTIAAFFITPLHDPDVWWHIVAGRWMLAHGTVPAIDYWTTFGAGKPWRAYSWSVEVLLALIDRRGGAGALCLAQWLLSVLLIAVLFEVNTRISRDRFFGGVLATLVSFCCYGNFGLRPQTFVWICFALLLLLLQRIAVRGRSRGSFLLLALLMASWSNAHLTSVIGVAACAAWLFRPKHFADAVIAGLAAFAGSLCTPYLGGEWLTMIEKSDHPFVRNTILEFQPATILQYPTVAFLFLLLCFGALSLGRETSFPSTRFLFGLVLAIGGLGVVKFLPFAAIYLGAAAASWWPERNTQNSTEFHFAQAINGVRRVLSRVPASVLASGLVVVALPNFCQAYLLREQYPVDRSLLPERPMDFVLANALPFPLLNSFGAGGYVSYRLSDGEGHSSVTVPIDGRTNVTPVEVQRKSLLAYEGARNWREFFDLVHPATVLWRSDSPLVAILLADGGWCEVYRQPERGPLPGWSVFLHRDEFAKRSKQLSAPNCN